MIIMNKEQQRLSILEYYVAGKLYNPEHDKAVIRQLRNQGYLRCGITSNIEETFMTTDNGLLYLDLAGIDVEAPVIVGGRICKSKEAANSHSNPSLNAFVPYTLSCIEKPMNPDIDIPASLSIPSARPVIGDCLRTKGV